MAQKVGEIYYDVTLDTQGLIDGQRDVDRNLDKIGRAGDGLKVKFTAIAAAITAALSAIAVESLVSKIVTAQRQFDVLFSSLKTMTGGTEQATAAWERLVAFAAQTPYSLDQAVKGFTKLKALGLDPSERAMMSFGNTASAMGKDLMQMIEAVADASTSQFERLLEFGVKAKQNGDKVSLTFRGVTTNIGNNAAEITEYLTKLGEVNFPTAMSERMKTLDGDISNLEDSLQALYLSISQSGFGDVIASSVRSASQAIQEATTSIKEGGLTEYFDAMKPFIAAAEIAVVSLSAVIAGRLVAAFVAAAAQAYATAAAIGAATLAANGFRAVIALLGGPVGIAVTALSLLAFNWDKIASSAKNAAQISEESAARIAGAQKKSQDRAQKDLQGQLAEANKNLADTETKLKESQKKSIYGGTVGPKKDIDELNARRDAYLKSIGDIKKAMDDVTWTAAPESVLPDKVTPKASGVATPKAGKSAKTPFDSAGYLSGLAGDAATAWDRVAIIEAEAVRKADKLLKDKEISSAEHQKALTLIADNAIQERQKLMEADFNKVVELGERREEEEKRKAREAERIKYTRDSMALGTLQMQAEGGDPAAAEKLLVAQAAREQALVEEQRLLDLTNEQIYADRKVAIEKKLQDDIKAVRDTANQSAASSQMAIMDSLLNITKNAAGEQSGLYKVMFAAQKAFSIAQSIIAIQTGIANAASLPWPLNLGAMASVAAATASIVSTISGTNISGGRQYGGVANSGNMYRINEKGAPEMFTAGNGQQYMMPTQSGRVTAADQIGGGASVNIVVNNTAPGVSVTPSYDQQSQTVTIAVAEVANQIQNNNGPVWSAMRSSSNVQPRI